MRSRTWRFIILVVMLASGAVAAWSSWNTSRQITDIDRRQRDLTDRVDQLLATLDTVTTGQQAYVTPSPGQDPAGVLELIGQIRAGTDSLRPRLQSIESGLTVQTVAAGAATLNDVETRAQEHLRSGQNFMAADLIFSDGRAADDAIASGLRTIRASETEVYTTARADALDALLTIGGAVALVWVIGALLLVRIPAPAVSADLTTILAPMPSFQTIVEPANDLPLHTGPDLQAAADVCTAIGRLTSADDLPRLLQQAAAVLDAPGIVIWMAAGEELFAAAAFGYPAQVIKKLGPINRSAINATAAAWRSGALQAVSGGHDARGALAAPMFGPERCVGVLAVEVGVGQEGDASRRAVATMFAAQLAAALAGWPAASAAAPANVPPLVERVAEG
jgi:CHASE3 domain sensor protein